jgi:hypothetical protein
MLPSPATFETWVEDGYPDAYDSHILVVMTQSCYDSLSGSIVVHNGLEPVTIAKAAFTGVTDNAAKVPPGHMAQYTVAALKDHLGYGLSVPLSAIDTIYWALADAPVSEPLDKTHMEFTVTVPSPNARALIYAMGSSVDDSGDLDTGVPATQAGFVVSHTTTPVGGEWITLAKLQLVAPWLSSGLLMLGILASFIYVRRIKKRQD